MSKPWLETWRLGKSEEGHGNVDCGDGVWFIADSDSRHDTGETRFPTRDRMAGIERLAAAAPALVRALLPQEFVPRDGNDESCQACNAYGPELRGTFSVTDYHAEYGPSGHKEGCPLDAALTAAGLPDQASRDEARAEIAGRK